MSIAAYSQGEPASPLIRLQRLSGSLAPPMEREDRRRSGGKPACCVEWSCHESADGPRSRSPVHLSSEYYWCHPLNA
eukprot:5976127-Alexandrium_andersonii.AAC.1